MTRSPWPATARYGLEPAPGTLALVHDLLNTVSAGGRRADLLADLSSAQEWADSVAADWSAATGSAAPRVALDEEGRERLLEYRRSFQDAAALGPPAAEGPRPAVVHSAEVSLDLHGDGLVVPGPRGSDTKHLASMLLITAWQSQLDDTWRRLKTCRNTECRVAFYDRSRNNSGVWHDVKTCGNLANLRAHRARRRLADEAAQP
ncbi:CGNR zinc finger domain-containing protein [Streptomyces sp. NPDC026672]|uniref:CGNR zinc finger domain-containing protein n=1 Tax=unclassified Streptomyces TaxID=2593676 RepID=UPI0033D20B4A